MTEVLFKFIHEELNKVDWDMVIYDLDEPDYGMEPEMYIDIADVLESYWGLIPVSDGWWDMVGSFAVEFKEFDTGKEYMVSVDTEDFIVRVWERDG